MALVICGVRGNLLTDWISFSIAYLVSEVEVDFQMCIVSNLALDFVAAFWHCECICELSEKTFTTKYQKWCKKRSHNFSQDKALDIYVSACRHFSVMPRTNTSKLLVEQAVSQLRAASAAVPKLCRRLAMCAASIPKRRW